MIKITDDGDGFSKDIVDKLGEPYVSKNNRDMSWNIYIKKLNRKYGRKP